MLGASLLARCLHAREHGFTVIQNGIVQTAQVSNHLLVLRVCVVDLDVAGFVAVVDVVGVSEEFHHVARPLLFQLLVQVGQLAQVVGVAQCVQTLQCPVRFPAIV